VLNGLDMLVEQAISQVALFADGGEGEARAGHDGGGATTAVDEPREAARVREAMRRAVGSLAGATRASSASSSGSASTSDDGRR